LKTRSQRRQGPGPCLCSLVLTAAALGGASPAGARSAWEELASPTATLLNAVKFLNRSEGWGVGDRGTVVRYSNGSWVNFPSGTDEDLFSISVLGTGEAWAVGRNGAIVHYNGTTWNLHPQSRALTLLPLTTVRFLAPDIGWAVGGAPCRSGVALRYNGASWVSATTTNDPLYGVEVLADDNVWFCGGGRRLMHFDGTGFTVPPCPLGDGKAWYALTFPFTNRGYVVGDDGLIWRYTTNLSPPCFGADPAQALLTTQALRGISMLPGEAAGMVVGDAGVRLKFNPGARIFEADAAGGQDLRGVDVINELEGQAVGGTNVSQTNVEWGYDTGVYLFSTCPQTGELGNYADSFVASWPVFFRIRARLAGVDYYSPEYRIAAYTGSCDPWDTPPPGDAVAAGATHLIPTGAVQSHGPHCLGPSDPGDWYSIDMTAGVTYTLGSIDTDPLTGGVAVEGGVGDVAATIYSDPAGVVPVATDDNTGSNYQFRMVFTATASGTYFLRVSLVDPASDWQGMVQYSQSGAPRADITLVSWPPSFTPGGTVTVSWDLGGFESSARIVASRAQTAETDLSRVRLFPNPFDPRAGEILTFDRLPADLDRLEIYTVRGERVAWLKSGVEFSKETGVAYWSGRILTGKPAATGSYPFRMHTRSGKTFRGLIIVVKK